VPSKELYQIIENLKKNYSIANQNRAHSGSLQHLSTYHGSKKIKRCEEERVSGSWLNYHNSNIATTCW